MSVLRLPLIVINFKTFSQSTGKNAVSLAKTAEEVASSTNTSIALAVQAVDIRIVSENTSLPVLAQHVDSAVFGSNTGSTLPEAVKDAGAVGTLLNHAENKKDDEFLKNAIARCKETELTTILCAESKTRALAIASFPAKPDFIAIEPPELIGGNVSVSSANPGIISGAVAQVQKIAKIPVLAGAGINSTEDVCTALKLGAEGVLVASAIVKSDNQKNAIEEIAKGANCKCL